VLKTDKERIVAELVEDLSSAETLIVADYRGLTNKQLEALRDQLIPLGARFRIVKNTLTRRAAETAGAEALLVMLEGPTAVAFIESSGDPAAVAKALAATAKETNVLVLRGGLLEGKQLSREEIEQLATLPPVDVLRAQLVGAVVAPLTQLLGLVSAPLRDVYGLLDARIKQLEENGEIGADAASAEVEEEQELAPKEEDESDAATTQIEASAEEETAAPTPEASAAAEASDSEESSEPDQAPEEE